MQNRNQSFNLSEPIKIRNKMKTSFGNNWNIVPHLVSIDTGRRGYLGEGPTKNNRNGHQFSISSEIG
jgi:hypothetical protein